VSTVETTPQCPPDVLPLQGAATESSNETTAIATLQARQGGRAAQHFQGDRRWGRQTPANDQHGTTFTGDVVLDLFMRLDDSAAAAEFPQVLKDALGAVLKERNLIGTTAEVISRIQEYGTAGVTILVKPVYRSVPEMLKMMEKFSREIMPATK
jgi:hypothetical protein